MKAISLFLVFLAVILASSLAFGKNPLRFEVLCPKSFTTLELSKLCVEGKKKCRWKKVESSKRASAWLKRNQYKVIENPLVKGIKVEVLNPKLSGLNLPWCFATGSLNLPKSSILKQLVATKETLYLLSNTDVHHLPRLKAIEHPCRILRTMVVPIKGFNFYYLEPQRIKACRLGK